MNQLFAREKVSKCEICAYHAFQSFCQAEGFKHIKISMGGYKQQCYVLIFSIINNGDTGEILFVLIIDQFYISSGIAA